MINIWWVMGDRVEQERNKKKIDLGNEKPKEEKIINEKNDLLCLIELNKLN